MSVVIKPAGVKPVGVVVGPKLITDGSLEGSSFKLAKPVLKHRLIVSVEGLEKQGKTHFALSAPGPIAYMDFDVGSEGVLHKFAGKEVHIADYRLEFPFDQRKADSQWKQFSNDYKVALGSPIRSLVVDTATEAWELLRVAKFGKTDRVLPTQYGPVNSEYREMLRMAYDSDVNLVLLHKQKKMYVNEQWNGKFERAGFADTGFMSQVNVEAFKRDGDYRLKIVSCRQNPSCEGKEISNSFVDLGLTVFPDSKEEEWK